MSDKCRITIRCLRLDTTIGMVLVMVWALRWQYMKCLHTLDRNGILSSEMQFFGLHVPQFAEDKRPTLKHRITMNYCDIQCMVHVLLCLAVGLDV